MSCYKHFLSLCIFYNLFLEWRSLLHSSNIYYGDMWITIRKSNSSVCAYWQVITAQYFVWFFCLLPLILPWSNMKLKWKDVSCIILWVGAQLHWLLWGYLLEFKGKNVFLQMWMASILFLGANTYLLTSIIRSHRYSAAFNLLENTSVDAKKVRWWSKSCSRYVGCGRLRKWWNCLFYILFLPLTGLII